MSPVSPVSPVSVFSLGSPVSVFSLGLLLQKATQHGKAVTVRRAFLDLLLQVSDPRLPTVPLDQSLDRLSRQVCVKATGNSSSARTSSCKNTQAGMC